MCGESFVKQKSYFLLLKTVSVQRGSSQREDGWFTITITITRRVLEGGEMRKDHVRKMIIRSRWMERNVVMINVSSSIIDQDPGMEVWFVCVCLSLVNYIKQIHSYIFLSTSLVGLLQHICFNLPWWTSAKTIFPTRLEGGEECIYVSARVIYGHTFSHPQNHPQAARQCGECGRSEG